MFIVFLSSNLYFACLPFVHLLARSWLRSTKQLFDSFSFIVLLVFIGYWYSISVFLPNQLVVYFFTLIFCSTISLFFIFIFRFLLYSSAVRPFPFFEFLNFKQSVITIDQAVLFLFIIFAFRLFFHLFITLLYSNLLSFTHRFSSLGHFLFEFILLFESAHLFSIGLISVKFLFNQFSLCQIFICSLMITTQSSAVLVLFVVTHIFSSTHFISFIALSKFLQGL